MEQTKQQRYNAYVLEQKHVANKLLMAFDDFEKIADMPVFSHVEDEFLEMVRKLKEIIAKPEEFARELDEEEDW
jgi:predicted esterase YcpF (UPF0227 family)